MNIEVLTALLCSIVIFLLGAMAGIFMLNFLTELQFKKHKAKHEKEIITFIVYCDFDCQEEVINEVKKFPVVYMENVLGDKFEYRIQGPRKQMEELRTQLIKLDQTV